MGIIVAAIFAQRHLSRTVELPVPYEVARNFPYEFGEYKGIDVSGPEASRASAVYAPTAIVYREYKPEKGGDSFALLVASMWKMLKDPSSCTPYYGYRQVNEQVTELPGQGKVTEFIVENSPGEYQACSMSWHAAGQLYSRDQRVRVMLLAGKHEKIALIAACKDATSVDHASSLMPDLRVFVSQVSKQLDSLNSVSQLKTSKASLDRAQ